jgi:DNA-binding response OmpR family regulator
MKRILTVDDSRAMRSIIQKALAVFSVEVLQAADGQQGLAAVEESAPDLILLDLTMPVMDGAAMLKELRGRGNRTPVILLTAESGTSTIGPLLPLGFEDYIVKPFKAEELHKKVTKVLNPPRIQVQVEQPDKPAEKAAAAKGGKPVEVGAAPAADAELPLVDILVVDDMDNVAKQLRTMLPAHIQLLSCADAQSAGVICRERRFRVILVDLVMPDVNSASLVRQLRALRPDAVFVGLVMRTVKNPLLTANEAGLNGALVKPFDVEQVEDFLGEHFQDKNLVESEENVLRVAPFSGRRDRDVRHFARVGKLLLDTVEELAAACYPQLILDVTQVPRMPDPLMKMLVPISLRARELGMEMRLVAPAEVRRSLKEVVETADIPSYETVLEAQGLSEDGTDTEAESRTA